MTKIRLKTPLRVGRNHLQQTKEMRPTGRTEDFQKIRGALSSAVKMATLKALIVEGDSARLLPMMPDHSVSLILTDPPYHSTKKRNIFADTSFAEDEHYIEWLTVYAKEWRRVLKPNGTLFCFCAPEMTARIEVMFRKHFNILAQIVWTKPNDPGFDGWKQKMKKEALRQWYPHSERIIFAEPAYEGSLHRSYFGSLLREMREKAGLSGHQLTELIGAYGRINHGGAVSNWEAGRNIPSPEQYEKLKEALAKSGKINSMPPYNDVIRPFYVDKSNEFTDIWSFPSVRPYRGKHPAEKPIPLLKHAIASTTYPGDIVLDCFAGSGSTAFAALALGRFCVAVEIESTWVNTISSRLELGLDKAILEDVDMSVNQKTRTTAPQPTLFSDKF